MFDLQLAIDNFPFILSGLPNTLLISFVSFACGLLIGFVLAQLRTCRIAVIRWLTAAYISLMRGTPMMVLLFALYFGLPFLRINLNAIIVSICSFSFMSAAYLSEIIRASLSAIDGGQWEAGAALGLSRGHVMQHIILPQAARIALPSLGNVLTDIIKGSALTGTITVAELFNRAKQVGGGNEDYLTAFFAVACVYWALCTLCGAVISLLEKRLTV